MRKSAIITVAVAAIIGLGGVASWAAEDEGDPAALAKALSGARISLERGLKAGASVGRPISAKYELDDGALQLSVYTMTGADQFSEVIVDHKTGAVKKREAITEGDDLKDAKEQSVAVARAKIPLGKALGDAVRANGGFRAVSGGPPLKGGHPVPDIAPLGGHNGKKIPPHQG